MQAAEPPAELPPEPALEALPAVELLEPALAAVVPAVEVVAAPAAASLRLPSPPPPQAPTRERHRVEAPNSKIEVAFRMRWVMTSRMQRGQRVEKIWSFD
jgi:hypothetical protein